MDLINIDAVKKLMEDSKLNPSALAKRCRVSRACVSRILAGKRQPSSTFIAGFREAFPNLPLDRYFFNLTVTDECHRNGTDDVI